MAIRFYRRLLAISILLTATVLAQQSRSVADFPKLSAKADAARDANRLNEAAKLYREALAARPGWAEGWWSLGTIEYDRNDYTQAAQAFRKLAALAPKSGNA